MLARVILPLALEEEYAYRIPDTWSKLVAVGMRVLVQFGSKRYYYAIISQLIDETDKSLGRLKSIIALPDREPIVTPEELNLWRWGASYYMCSIGAWLVASIPSNYLPSSETQVMWRDAVSEEGEKKEIDYRPTELSEKIRHELLLMHGHQAKASKLAKLLGRKVYPEIDRLLRAGVLLGSETIARDSRSVQVGSPAIQLAKKYCSEDLLTELMGQLSRAKAQKGILEHLLDLLYQHELPLGTPLLREALIAKDANKQAALRALIKRGVVKETYSLSNPLLVVPPRQSPLSEISNEELQSSKLVDRLLSETRIPFLFQATSNQEQIDFVVSTVKQLLQKRPTAQILIYVPQLFLFEQSLLYHALQQVSRQREHNLSLPPFDLVLYSSSTTDAERIAIRARLLGLTSTERGLLILSSRMGSLLPLSCCDLIIITDEESNRYKQSETAPRYQARDLTIVACKQSLTPLLLTTVAPSAETLYNLQRGYYLSINNKGSSVVPNEVAPTPRPFKLIDLTLQRKHGKLPWGQMLSIELRKAILSECRAKRKSVLLLNRRGYAPHLICHHCQKVLTCPNCDVGLVYHKSTQSVSCSYCNYTASAPRICPQCHQGGDQQEGREHNTFSIQGYGIERIAEELTNFIPPEIHILELSASQYYNKKTRQQTRQQIESDEPVILVGTSSLIYLDAICNVGLIALVNLDQMIVGDDFRANERAYASVYRFSSNYPSAQLYIQSYQTDIPLLQSLQGGETARPYGLDELAERAYLRFPPYVHLIYLYVRGASKGDVCYTVSALSQIMQDDLYQSLWQASSPITPHVSRIRMHYIRYICMRIDPSSSWREVHKQICHIITTVQKRAIQARRLQIYCDVDPL